MSATAENSFLRLPTSALISSLLFHAFVPIFFFTMSYLNEMGLIPFFGQKKIDRTQYQNFIQVDVVALPDELINEKKRVDMSLPVVDKTKTELEEVKATTPEETLTEAEAKSEQDEMAEMQKAKEKKAAADRILKEKQRAEEQERALKRIQEDAAREAALKSLAKRDGKTGRQKLAGNITSKGTSTTGMIGTAKDRYTGLVHEAIKEHFNIYDWQRKKKLSAVVRINIFATGRVRDRRIITRSADPYFDSAVLKAIDNAQPLPIPDDMSIVSEGIVVEFKPE